MRRGIGIGRWMGEGALVWLLRGMRIRIRVRHYWISLRNLNWLEMRGPYGLLAVEEEMRGLANRQWLHSLAWRFAYMR